MKRIIKLIARHLLPRRLRSWAISRWQGHEYIPPVGLVDLGELRRVTPLSRNFGFDRGRAVDRYYIEQFLERNAADVKGCVLEIADPAYTRRFGGACVTQSDVLHVEAGHPDATIVGDLTRGDNLPSAAYDCFICTQTLNSIFDVRAAIRTTYRLLKPGGVALVTVSGISQPISRVDMDNWGDYWRFTSRSIRQLFAEVFPPSALTVEARGNPLTALALIHGLAMEELRAEELDHFEPDYEVSLAVRAVKPEGA